MEKKDIISIQVVIVIAFIGFIFTIISTFPIIQQIGYGVGVITSQNQFNLDFGAVQISIYAFISFFLYLILVSLQLYGKFENGFYILSQILFWIGVLFILMILFFIVPSIASNYNPWRLPS
jgi:hypothetical protein